MNSISMRLFLIVILLFCIQASPAQLIVQYDSSAPVHRNFNAQQMAAYNTDEEFQYNRYKEPPVSLWEKFWSWFWRRIGDILQTDAGSAAFRTVFITLAVLVLAFFIYKLTGMNKAGLFKRAAGESVGYSVTEEDIHSINFDLAIEQAVQNRDFRLAVRLLYLQSLKQLADKNYINWQLNKTNIAYVQELKGTKHQPVFTDLTVQFENTWYGDMPISAEGFTEVRTQFNQFNRQIA
jgi:hypothetical protein